MASEAKKSIVNKIINDIKEDASAQYKIDSANFTAVKSDTKTRFDAAAESDEDFTEFREAKGLKEKASVVGRHLERDGKERRAQDRENYEEMLKQQREHINDLTRKNK